MTETKNIKIITKRITDIITAIKQNNLTKANQLFDDLEDSGLLTDKIYRDYPQLGILLQFTEGMLWDSGGKILGGTSIDDLDIELEELMEEIAAAENTNQIITIS